MDAVIVKETKALLKDGKDLPLIVTTANPFIFSELNDFVIWDDEKNTVFVIKANTNPVTNFVRPILMYAIDYAFIELMRVELTTDTFTSVAGPLKARGLISDAQIAKAINKFAIPTAEDMIGKRESSDWSTK